MRWVRAACDGWPVSGGEVERKWDEAKAGIGIGSQRVRYGGDDEGG